MAKDKVKICFVIAPIGEDGSETRKRSDQILKHIIEPVVSARGYKTTRADKLSKPGLITSQIINHILNDDLVIADLTEKNPNVYYELAIRHAVRKPIVQIISHTESIPFDVSSQRTIKFDYKDLDSVAFCKEELARQIEAVEEDPGLVDSPISNAIDVQALSVSGDPVAKTNAEIISMLQEMKADIATLRAKSTTYSGEVKINDTPNIFSSLTLKNTEDLAKLLDKGKTDSEKKIAELVENYFSVASHTVKGIRGSKDAK